MSLTPKQAAFVSEYLVDLNATQAAIRAGYSARTAEQQGSRLLSIAKVATAIQAAMNKRAARLEVSADRVLAELARLAFADVGQLYDERGQEIPIHELPEDIRRTVAGIEHNEYGRKLKLWSKPDSLVALGKHLKLFTERVEHSFDGQTDEQLQAKFNALTGKAG